jgi:hypothetical protein
LSEPQQKYKNILLTILEQMSELNSCRSWSDDNVNDDGNDGGEDI